MRIAALLACLALGPAIHARPQSLLPNLSVTATPVVTLLSTGAEPRRPLRYTATAGLKERLDIKMQASLGMKMGDMDMPPMDIPAMTMSLDMDVTAVNAEGDITVAMAFADIALAGAPTPPEIAAMKGPAGSMTVTSRGIIKSSDFSSLSDPAMKQLISSAGIEKLSTPLPAEALGVGARWEVSQGLSVNGINTTQKTTFEVVAIDAASVSIKTTVVQTAPPQKPQLAGMPPGADVSLVSLDGGGTGSITIAPGSLVPSGEMSVQMAIVMDVSADGQSQRMSTSTGTKVTMTKGKR